MQTTSENTIKEIFAAMPDHSRVWIYQCDRFMVPHEVNAINEEGDRFVAGWNAHGTPLRAKIAIIENLFLVVMVDEVHAQASGCSIDKSLHFVKESENYLGCSLTDRMKVSVDLNGKIMNTDLRKLAEFKAQGLISENSIVFDNLVDTKEKLEKNWKVRLGDSWHARFL